jgi:hypothetical protein
VGKGGVLVAGGNRCFEGGGGWSWNEWWRENPGYGELGLGRRESGGEEEWEREVQILEEFERDLEGLEEEEKPPIWRTSGMEEEEDSSNEQRQQVKDEEKVMKRKIRYNKNIPAAETMDLHTLVEYLNSNRSRRGLSLWNEQEVKRYLDRLAEFGRVQFVVPFFFFFFRLLLPFCVALVFQLRFCITCCPVDVCLLVQFPGVLVFIHRSYLPAPLQGEKRRRKTKKANINLASNTPQPHTTLPASH